RSALAGRDFAAYQSLRYIHRHDSTSDNHGLASQFTAALAAVLVGAMMVVVSSLRGAISSLSTAVLHPRHFRAPWPSRVAPTTGPVERCSRSRAVDGRDPVSSRNRTPTNVAIH